MGFSLCVPMREFSSSSGDLQVATLFAFVAAAFRSGRLLIDLSCRS